MSTHIIAFHGEIRATSWLKKVPYLEQSYCLFVLRFYGPVNPMGSCRARSVYLTTRLLNKTFFTFSLKKKKKKRHNISFKYL